MQEKAANIILGKSGPSERFSIRWGFITFRLGIKPVPVKYLIEISAQLSKIKDINPEGELFPEMISNVSDLKYIARSVAIATGTRFRCIVTRAILKLPTDSLEKLFNIVIKQSDPRSFFFIIASARGVNKLKPKEGS